MLQLNAVCKDLLMLSKKYFSKFLTRDQPKKYQFYCEFDSISKGYWSSCNYDSSSRINDNLTSFATTNPKENAAYCC